ncbi:MAG: bifunctional UDP-3-O-[3-hydroxymyristoyl] N-acetylglucosamine deacetylase/3-hydroxyacyl-ACP dehydratase [Bacteroidales bacterium]|nr:bifunctional UDP-3-O-[3-hydroxymyristoyl] N-acetylglucosamine deacetylase/3-hydroxyacyl-ACP dehydratase [Bacteroidales bacterium]
MAEKQKTIKQAGATLKGKGLHTGVAVEMTFKPAPENFGYRFKRIDLENQPEIRAIVDNVTDTTRSTTVEENGAKVGTIEHVMSALYALGIDNILIEINAPETPILDGCSATFVKNLLEAGIVEQEAEKVYYVVKNNINYSDEEKGIELMTFPDDNISFNVMVDYNSPVLGNQYATLNSFKTYPEEIAPCKTFCFLREVEYLINNNLIKGGTLNNALVIMDQEKTQEELDALSDKLGRPRVNAKGRGILNEEELIFANEPARHKLLDLVGDLALIGMPIKGKILATRPGHASNVQFAKLIRQEIKKSKQKGQKVEFDITKPAIIDINRIKEIMPHRYPFLLVDKIIEMTKTEIVGIKNITFNEPFFQGHFPGEPVMPGVLQIEAMAQTGGILVLSNVDEPEHYSTYFVKIDKVKFKGKVIPGDVLVFKLELTEPIRRGIVTMRGQAFVNGSIVSEGELTAMITKNR